MTMTPLPTRRTLPAQPRTRLVTTWVKVVDNTGRPRMEMRWTQAPYVHLNAA